MSTAGNKPFCIYSVNTSKFWAKLIQLFHLVHFGIFGEKVEGQPFKKCSAFGVRDHSGGICTNVRHSELQWGYPPKKCQIIFYWVSV